MQVGDAYTVATWWEDDRVLPEDREVGLILSGAGDGRWETLVSNHGVHYLTDVFFLERL